MNRRLYFYLTNGLEVIQDTEGVEAEALGEAIAEAQSALNEMRIGQAKMPADGWQLIIRDESGLTLRSMPLDDGGLH
jgi:hypothetical protein